MAIDIKSVLTFEKPPSGGKAEIENVTEKELFHVFNFSSATRGRFSNVDTLLASMTT